VHTGQSEPKHHAIGAESGQHGLVTGAQVTGAGRAGVNAGQLARHVRQRRRLPIAAVHGPSPSWPEPTGGPPRWSSTTVRSGTRRAAVTAAGPGAGYRTGTPARQFPHTGNRVGHCRGCQVRPAHRARQQPARRGGPRTAGLGRPAGSLHSLVRVAAHPQREQVWGSHASATAWMTTVPASPAAAASGARPASVKDRHSAACSSSLAHDCPPMSQRCSRAARSHKWR
jgi:hypothetical protein